MKERVKGKNIKKSKLIKRTISVLMALSLTFNVTPFDVFHINAPFGIVDTEVEDPLAVTASAAELTYTPSNPDTTRFANNTAFPNNDTGKSDFLDFCYFYQTDNDFAAQYVNATISVNFITFPAEFMGLGNENVKFKGDFRIQDSGEANVNIPRAIFTHVYDSAKITNAEGNPMSLKVVKTSDQSSPLIAEYVYHDESEGAVSASWDVTVASENSNPYAGVIGEMEDGAKLTIAYANHSSAPVSSTSDDTDGVADVGAICGSMKGSSELTVGISAFEETTISSANGNAGGLVGSMEDTSKIIVTSLPNGFAPTVTASGAAEGKGYAGGVVGSMLSSASVDTTALGTGAFNIDGTISGTNGAGGYCGHYVNSAEDATLDLSKYNITATVSGNSSGGVFGVFENQSAKYTITGGGTGENDPKIASTCSGGNYGGVIGTYKSVALSEETTALANTLHLKNMNAFAEATGTLTTFGGAIGKVNSAAYIRTDTVKIEADGTNQGWFGGLVGETSANDGVFIDLADFTLEADGFTGGGVVGKFHNGVLRLSGITDMTSAAVGGTWTTAAKYGQLVGENDNVLVYAIGDGTDGTAAVFDEEDGTVKTAASGWSFKRSANSIADDLGTWGEVVRVADVESDILTLDTSAHTVTLKAAQTTMDSAADLVLTALNMQLNQGSGYDCLLFADTSASVRDTLLAGTLTISGSQSFAGTGVNGFMRDGSESIGAFTGTLTGGTVTLAIGEKYGYNVTLESTGEGLGQIYRHPYNGLFSIVGSNTAVNNVKPTAGVNTLEVAGNIDIRNAGMSELYVGGIAAKADGNVTLNGIKASQNVYYHEGANIDSSSKPGKSIGGLIGYLSSEANGSTIAVTGTNEISTAFTLSGNHKSWNILGSFIGKVVSPAFTINIAQNATDSLTDKHKTDISGVTNSGANADGGGLIGYITRNGTYSNRKINIDNLTFNGCTVGNVATTNGGGLLGYAWLETDTTIGGTNGITVTDATITNSAPGNVGAMCYQATGKWTVDKLTINKLTMTGGAGTSLGMLVNKAYNEYTESASTKTDGLYLNVLNSGYALNNVATTQTVVDPETNEQVVKTLNTIDLPASGVYDELAVYTAQDVLKGRYTSGNTTYGAGVISINMGTRSDGVVSVAATGTYQNKMTAQTEPNPNARYYYNLDKMAKSNATQDVVLWSVNKYAAENIKDIFDASANSLNKDATTDINLTGISFYPVYTASDDTVANVNITFDYSGMYDAESYGSTNTDEYVRDPGVVNQHYLMQSGLFIEQSEGSTLTVNNSSLAGTFLEVGDYKGALISTTSHGSVRINGLELRGITPQTTGDAAYTNGYLLVNSVNRENAQKAMITLDVKNVSTATDTNYKYATTGEGNSTRTTQVTKSLFGSVYGPGLIIAFDKMKLDAREPGTLADNTALNTAYGTVNSIFTDSTFLASLKTDALPMPYYNYTFEEDWGTNGTGGTRWVTYGKEVNDSVEHLNREHRYYKNDEKFTDPTSATATDIYAGFSSGWLPYVKQEYTANQTHDENGCYYRELRVNVWDVVTSSGCGTYNDPYIINAENQNGSDKKFLENVAAFLKSGDGQNLPNIYLPTNYEDYDSLEENTTGARWCENKNHHAQFVYDASNTSNKVYKYTPEGGETIIWKEADVRQYLENAYYRVEGAITLSGGETGFVGLGADSATTPTGNYAFRGVIVGANNATITNNSSNPLIMISNGCVVKNVTVVQNANVELKQYKNTATDAAFGYKIPSQKNESGAGCAYYGGIIGEIMGGDNIIDNCYVTQGTDVSVNLTGTQASICPVGSYVGVVVYGGLIFKNMAPVNANRNAQAFRVYMGNDTSVNLTAETSKGAIYVNPYVGRVINGYAVNETKGATGRFSVTENSKYHDDDGTARNGNVHSLKNHAKHYSIADINKSETNKLDVTAVATASADGNIDVPNSQALFILSLITQSCAGTATDAALGAYTGSLSYGTYSDSVYGMSHNAEYSDVGTDTALVADDPETEDVDERNVTDYQTLALYDTANNADGNAPIPYIVKHYTEGSTDVRLVTEIEEQVDITYNLDGLSFAFMDSRGDNRYLVGSETKNIHDRDTVLNSTTELSGATEIHIEKCASGDNYYLWFGTVDNKTYLKITNKNGDRGNLELSSSPYEFTIEKYGNYYEFGSTDQATKKYINYSNKSSAYHFEAYKTQSDKGNQLRLFVKSTGVEWTGNVTTETRTEIPHTSVKPVHDYPARCVTSTSGYYNINLASNVSYQLPDSFRGLGCVGIYDMNGNDNEAGKSNKYSIKLNSFDGKNNSIDVDIYLNKYLTDNYFDVLHKGTSQALNTDTTEYILDAETQEHGIGLFDSVIPKGTTSGGTSAVIKNFTLSGSVKTAVFNNNQQQYLANNNMLWHSTGGVVGWLTKRCGMNFEKIDLNNLAVEGSNYIGGLLADGAAVKSDIYKVTISECNAYDISLKMDGAKLDASNDKRPLNAMGAFLGKYKEGKVIVYGTSYKTANPDTSQFSTVRIKKYSFGDTSKNYSLSCGGIVGFSGHGFECYDMKVTSSSGLAEPITIGYDFCGSAGGICALIQPHTSDNDLGVAVFKNCTVENINVNGRVAGGIYGGKWNNAWVVQSLTLENCQVKGTSASHNTIISNGAPWYGSSLANCAGGLVGYGVVYKAGTTEKPQNITISDCLVENYDISAPDTAYTGGFIGYADTRLNSATFYIHDSSVEHCILGQGGKDKDYCGGAIGGIASKTANKMLGYNIKLDTVTSSNTNRVGAWIGKLNDSTTTIQFSGVGVYGNGFESNVGAGSAVTSFVFADYNGASEAMTTSNENKATFNIGSDVTMPKYPYVNVNPQSNMGVRSDSTNAVISGDGAVLLANNAFVPIYSIYTSGRTMAAKLYADIKTGTYDRRYTTCADTLKNTVIADGHKFEYYLQRTVSDDGDRISTYKTEHGNLPSGVEDFACIMISTADNDETTNLINQYIRLVTNTTNDYADTNDYYDVDIKTCKLVEDQATGTGEFQLITNPSDPDYTPGIEHDKTNKLFKMTKNKQNADSNKENTFTLIDVQFKDPLDKTKVAYHLYVPVFTTVQLEVNFSAAMKSGTNSVSYLADGITVDRSEYEGILDDAEYIHIDNLNTWYTMYFRYSYSKNDLQPLLNTGNLNWNHDKYVTLTKLGNAITNMLPENTFMTLVNPNSGADKVYYVNALNSTDFPRTTFVESNETRVSLTLDFKKFKGVDNQSFKVATLNEMVAQDLKEVSVATQDGAYDLVGTEKPADFSSVSYVYVMDAAGNKTYYKYTPGSGNYNLQFKSSFTGLNEDYYVSAYVPETDMSKIYGYDISVGDKFPAPRVAGTNALPKSANVVTEYDSRLVYLGDLYNQTVTFQVKTPDQVITSSNKVLDAYAVTQIEAKSVPILGILASAKRYTSLFHSYVLTLDRHGENGEIMTKIYGLDKNEDQSSRVTAWYSFDNQIPDDDTPTATLVNNVDVQNNYINVATVKDEDNLMDRIAPDADHITPVTIYSRVRMDFDPTKLETEFPQKTRTDAGVSVRVASNLAYDTSGLAFSSSSKSANDNLGHLYYRTSMDTANLYYKPLTPNLDKYDYDGEYSENYTRVGVNGRRSMSDYMPIDTIANYDYSKVVQAWDEAVNVRLSISLQKKTDTKVDGKVTGVQYANISDITQYWGGIELVADDSGILKPKETLFEHNGNSSFRLTLKDTTSIIINNQEYPVNANTETITVTVPKNTLECDTASYLATIPISFNAKTGTTITQYANYKVNLTVQLLDGSGDPIESCTANDWLVYTNAKINHEFLNNGDD